MSMGDDTSRQGEDGVVTGWDGRMGILGRADRCGEEEEERKGELRCWVQIDIEEGDGA